MLYRMLGNCVVLECPEELGFELRANLFLAVSHCCMPFLNEYKIYVHSLYVHVTLNSLDFI